jgi:hypothetical protein
MDLAEEKIILQSKYLLRKLRKQKCDLRTFYKVGKVLSFLYFISNIIF